VLPDKITIYRGPLERLYAHDPERLRREVRGVVSMRSPTTSGSATTA